MPTQYCTPFMIVDQETDREGVLRRIAEQASQHPAVAASERDVFSALREREMQVCTAIGHGVAIPHCAVLGMDQLVLGLHVYRSGVDMGAPDGQPVTIIFFILGPPEARTQHVQLLAAVSRAVREESFRNELNTAQSEQALLQSVQRQVAEPEEPTSEPLCRVRVLMQSIELLETVLQELSGFGVSSLSILTGESARTYLGQMALFASLWTGKEQSSIRIIEGYVKRSIANDVVSRIRDLTDSFGDKGRGVLVTVEEMLIVHGSLEL